MGIPKSIEIRALQLMILREKLYGEIALTFLYNKLLLDFVKSPRLRWKSTEKDKDCIEYRNQYIDFPK